MTQLANELKLTWKREGIDKTILSFSMGEPDFDTPSHIVEAAAEATRGGKTHYTPSLGIPELRAAVAAKCVRDNDIPCTAEDVMITPTKLGIFEAINAIVSDGDDALVPDPGWVSYVPMVHMAGGNALPLPTKVKDNFQVTGELIRRHATEKTKLVVICSPSNPTGAILSEESLKSIADAVKELDLYVVADEIYENLCYLDEPPVSMASLPGMMQRTVTLNGFSKSFAMTGWRVGYAVAPPDVLKLMNRIQQHTLTCTSSVAQYAALAALAGPKTPVEEMVRTFRERRDYLHGAVNGIDGLSCRMPDGAFYIFFSYDVDISSLDLAKRLLEEEGIAFTPGGAFGAEGEGFLRISYAASMEDLREGVARLARGYARIREEVGVKPSAVGDRCDVE
jgi:aspartate aminotransferase